MRGLLLLPLLLMPLTAAGVDVAVFTTPAVPVPGGQLRAIAVSEQPRDLVLAIVGPGDERLAQSGERRGGPPYWWSVTATVGGPGIYWVCGGDELPCDPVLVGERDPRVAGEGWPLTRAWDRATESFYAAWIEQLFADPLDAEPSWGALHEITRDPTRNLLHDHRGLGEDGPGGLRLEPDCADLPYFLRAYFAWKLGLPFGYSQCTRGGGGEPPTCSNWQPATVRAGGDALAAMQAFIYQLRDGVHSGAGRAPAAGDRLTDFYPVALSAESLRPGTVYADPYGHILVLVQRLPQTTRSGLLLAADAQPDGTVARKRYWRGNFLFAAEPALGSAGFKRFRPIVAAPGGLRPLTNAEIAASPAYGDYSPEQDRLGVEEFYERVDAVLSPHPREPLRALRDEIDALDEQVRARLRSVANGERYLAAHPGVIPMPVGAAIFETTGPWEDYATPSRDLRLLIAIDAVRAFPAAVERRPDRFVLWPGQTPAAVRRQLEALLRAEAAARRYTYTRSDGSSWQLSLAEVLARDRALEVGYNPNDCIEVRWGAPPGSAEAATCRRRAPAEQAERMEEYRPWFRERRRPPR